METSMYEDGNYTSKYSTRDRVNNLDQMKRKLTLDFSRAPKKQRQNENNFNPLLTSPDLKMLKLASPEIEKLLIQQDQCFPTVTVTSNSNNAPATSTTPAGFFFPSKHVRPTAEQEEFVKGFEDSLEQLRYQDNATSLAPTAVAVNHLDNNSVMVSSRNLEYTQLENHKIPTTVQQIGEDNKLLLGEIKEEPQTVPSVCGSPPMSPIDMESQERIKLERKRLRNRIAATKCRRRKLEKISKLEDKVTVLKNENLDLQTVVNRLKDQVCSLKQEVMEHVSSGCQIAFVTTNQ